MAIPDLDAEFGGAEARKKLEKKLVRHTDTRMSILIVIYIFNFVSRIMSVTSILRHDADPVQIDRNNVT